MGSSHSIMIIVDVEISTQPYAWATEVKLMLVHRMYVRMYRSMNMSSEDLATMS
jgi:hypothetical protein